ncbi:mapk-regulated corepressor-interacting protein 1 [Ctenocephalides felis]|uniref:mapk-regulated corepressor-interacting protein 1 n=1 Tax=Ctenocephalides felis TaxID=7515 RepID=UPI000E6E145D|nr:mapk-regulated corepressor-interacting protein 1 [Ctenocephalides felis]
MYTVSKGPSKIVAKTRRITQNLDRLETLRDLSRKPSDTFEENPSSTPKPIFHTNGRKSGSPRNQQEVISPHHEEIIRYINESWNHIANSRFEPYSPVHSASSSPEPASTLYYVDSPNAIMQNFKPFDLESWWGRRLFHNITKTL